MNTATEDTAKAAPDSPERVIIADAVASGARDLVLDMNPVFSSVSTRLIEAKPGQAQVSFTVPESMTRGNDVVAGGAITTMLDTAMVTAVFTRLAPGQTCTSINFTVNLLSAGRRGAFTAEGLLEKLGRRVGFASARLYDPEGRLVATASSAVAIITL